MIYYFGVPARFIYKRWAQLGLGQIEQMEITKFLLFNSLIKRQLKVCKSYGLDPHNRAASMGLELIYILSVFVPWAFPIVIINEILIKPPYVIGQPYVESFGPLDILLNVLAALIMIGLLNKDFFNGQSLVKRMGGYKVVDAQTMQPANKIKCLVRNITFPLWPLEVIMIWINPQRRLGDYIAGTRLIDVQSTEPELIFREIKGFKIDSQSIFVIGVSVIIIAGYTIEFW